ncbi:MAG: DUF3043 domain-containing protein [Actinobacteria bacterium]|uniref:Unannotated protein n=1 Tax=freshwater metagenome TaxID=449393 RepID=A0A6J7ASS4_9ZZZZ|nr:DUF3043 domain-containing protein [Actinomycetota bacterium]
MLGFKKKDSASGASSTDPAKAPPGSTTGAGPGGTKGHATPSRREAEDARKNQLKIPKDPKAAKKAARQRDQEERSRARQGMKNGEERYLPARDRGPARAFVRDFVDGRITLAEFFIFIAIAVLALGFIKNQFIQSWVSIGFFAVTALIVVDTVVLLVQLSLRAKKEFAEATDRKGLLLYATLRTLQLRRLRLPPPRVRRGGAPKV